MKFTGGINLNLSFSMKGYILDQSDSPTKMFSSGPNSYYHSVFRKKAQLSLWASCEYSKQITPLISWLIAPEIHFPLGSLTTGDYPLKQKYYTLQMRMGVNCLLSTTKNRK